jgi:membrane protease YdiL (CAAX protease family)
MGSTLLLWGLVAAASPVAEVICQIATGSVPAWFAWARIGVMAVALPAGYLTAALRPVRGFCAVYGFILAILALLSGYSRARLYLAEYGFIPGMLLLQLQGLVIAFAVLAFAWLRRRSWSGIFLRAGELAAPVRPAWLSVAGPPLRWRLLGPLVGMAGGLCVLGYVRYTGASTADPRQIALWAVLFAAINAFVEEALFRNALVSAVLPDFGARQAILVSTVIFGVGHWNGLPSGSAGVLMTSALGYFAAKAMIETKGMLWPWFMHFVPDVVVFYYWGLGAIGHRSIG